MSAHNYVQFNIYNVIFEYGKNTFTTGATSENSQS